MKKINILLMEDEPITAENMRAILSAQGYNVISGYPEIFTSRTGFPESIDEIMLGHDIAVVLMDVDLGRHLDGTDIVKHIRRTSGVPVIYISGRADTESVLRARRAGLHAYLFKPLDENQLKKEIETALVTYRVEKIRNPKKIAGVKDA